MSPPNSSHDHAQTPPDDSGPGMFFIESAPERLDLSTYPGRGLKTDYREAIRYFKSAPDSVQRWFTRELMTMLADDDEAEATNELLGTDQEQVHDYKSIPIERAVLILFNHLQTRLPC